MSTGEASSGSAATSSGPPYLPATAGLGGRPTPKVDDPICAVLLVLFIAAAAANMTILQVNLRRNHKFIISGMTFGFCMARTTALVLRIVWASRPASVSIAIAAQVFTVAGVVLLFLINLIFAQRIVRAYRPRLGWSRPCTFVFRFLFYSVPACLVMVIPATISSFYTRDAHKHWVDRRVQLVATTWMAVLAFLPMPITLLALFAPPRPPRHGTVESFGAGTMRTKVALLLFTSFLLAFGAAFRAGVNYKLRPVYDPAWFDSKPCYYCFNYAIEIIVTYTYTLSRFDRRFHVPNGSSRPGHYAAGGAAVAKDSDTEGGGAEEGGAGGVGRQPKMTLGDHINNEADVFGSETKPAGLDGDRAADNWDAKVHKELRMEREGVAA